MAPKGNPFKGRTLRSAPRTPGRVGMAAALGLSGMGKGGLPKAGTAAAGRAGDT